MLLCGSGAIALPAAKYELNMNLWLYRRLQRHICCHAFVRLRTIQLARCKVLAPYVFMAFAAACIVM